MTSAVVERWSRVLLGTAGICTDIICDQRCSGALESSLLGTAGICTDIICDQRCSGALESSLLGTAGICTGWYIIAMNILDSTFTMHKNNYYANKNKLRKSLFTNRRGSRRLDIHIGCDN